MQLSIALLALGFAASSRGQDDAAPAPACADALTWTVKNFAATFSEEVQTGGQASLTVVNDVTGAEDELKCSLRANSRCEIKGSAEDPDLHILIQLFIAELSISIDSNTECDGKTINVMRVGDFGLTCDDPHHCTLDEGAVTESPVALAPPDFQLPSDDK